MIDLENFNISFGITQDDWQTTQQLVEFLCLKKYLKTEDFEKNRGNPIKNVLFVDLKKKNPTSILKEFNFLIKINKSNWRHSRIYRIYNWIASKF